MNFINCTKANIYKGTHSKFLLFHLLIPLCGVIVFNLYYILAPYKEYSKVTSYIEVVAAAFSIVSSIAVSIIYENEKEAGNFQMMISVPCSKVFIHLSQIFTIILFAFISVIISILGFGIIFSMLGNKLFPISFYINIAMVMFILNIPIYMIQYIVSFSFGKLPVLMCGIIGSIVSLLMYTGIGDNIWFMIPFAYGIRMCDYISLKIIDFQLYLTLMNDISQSKIYMTIISCFIFIIFLLWASKYEAEKR